MQTTRQQNEERRKAFLTRARSGVFVVTFYIAYCLLLFFSNENWFKPLLNLNDTIRHALQFSLSFINILLLVPVIYFVARELTNLCFPSRKKVFIYTVCSIFVLVVGVGIFLLGTRYEIFTVSPRNEMNQFIFFLIVSLSAIVFVTIVSTLV
ncbi:MAG: hypothetical protein MJ219_00725 [Mycoplasmoidaceae bacterium]|nr:hypothetical protein [Mycoplasmoidaceae bacterium]